MAEFTSLRTELQKLILPVLTSNVDRTVTCIGTGFVIVANGRQAHMITAAHVMKKVREIENPHPTHHPTTPEIFLPVRYRYELHRAKPRALYYDEAKGAHGALIEASLGMTKADLELCSIRFQDDVPEDVQFLTRFGLDTSPVGYSHSVMRK